jgi:hypothetical protein
VRHRVNNTIQAADFLMHKWPVEPGESTSLPAEPASP